jgi:EAL domain-containing protein (putative c-di-GMP-specific phosphodiesterase class I)
VALAGNLRLNVIAEGVETRAQLLQLKELQCHQAQGTLFAEPLPAEAVPDRLSRTWQR